MRILHLSYSDIQGGASRATYRIHKALLKSGIDSRMLVSRSWLDDWTIDTFKDNLSMILTRIKPRLTKFLTNTLKTQNLVLHSPSLFPSCLSKKINASDADIINLHWINNEMLSIKDIGSIRKPVVWTLHDMWSFCGAEHYTEEFRWVKGYDKSNRPNYESGYDLNRLVWNKKRLFWKNPMHIVAPSQWIAACVKKSALMSNWNVTVIPNPLDINIWSPIEKNLARDLLGLPKNIPLLLFGAIGGQQDPRKGFDLLKKALVHLKESQPSIQLVIFGQTAPRESLNIGYPIHYMGHLHDDLTLRTLYSAADIMLVPSRQEAFGQTASEALACGTPVVAFGATGLLDIVDHMENGYLAKPYSSEDFAFGINWILSESNRYQNLTINARSSAVNKFSYETVSRKYFEYYKSILN